MCFWCYELKTNTWKFATRGTSTKTIKMKPLNSTLWVIVKYHVTIIRLITEARLFDNFSACPFLLSLDTGPHLVFLHATGAYSGSIPYLMKLVTFSMASSRKWLSRWIFSSIMPLFVHTTNSHDTHLLSPEVVLSFSKHDFISVSICRYVRPWRSFPCLLMLT